MQEQITNNLNTVNSLICHYIVTSVTKKLLCFRFSTLDFFILAELILKVEKRMRRHGQLHAVSFLISNFILITKLFYSSNG